MSVSVSELNDALKLDNVEEDSVLKIYLEAAIEFCTQYTGQKTSSGTETRVFSGFSDCLTLMGPKLAEVIVEYLDINGDTLVLDSSEYYVIASADRPYLISANAQGWPDTLPHPESVKITFSAGYDSSDLPPTLRTAILMAAGELYSGDVTASVILMGATLKD